MRWHSSLENPNSKNWRQCQEQAVQELVSYVVWRKNISKAYCMICREAESATYLAAGGPCQEQAVQELVSYVVWRRNISKMYCMICQWAESATFLAAGGPGWMPEGKLMQWDSESKLKKTRCHLKSHTVMVVKMKGQWLLGTDHSYSCSVAISPPPPNRFHIAENAVSQLCLAIGLN